LLCVVFWTEFKIENGGLLFSMQFLCDYICICDGVFNAVMILLLSRRVLNGVLNKRCICFDLSADIYTMLGPIHRPIAHTQRLRGIWFLHTGAYGEGGVSSYARCPVFNRTVQYFGWLSGIKIIVIPNNMHVSIGQYFVPPTLELPMYGIFES